MAAIVGHSRELMARLPIVRSHWRTILLVAGFAIATLILRLPSFFEPPWHTDEGIFEAVAQRVATGGRLYADAWESKPPLFLYTYVGIIKVFGAGVLPLRIVSAFAALITELAVFSIGLRFMSRRAALIAASLLAVCLAVPFWEGNLALTETFAQVPTSLAVLCALKGIDPDGRAGTRWLLSAGVFFGIAVLVRQTTGLVALGFVLWLMLSGRDWLGAAWKLALGAAAIVLPILAAFALFGSWHWFWDANVGFFFAYVPSGQQLPFQYRPLIVLPFFVTLIALFVYHRRGESPSWGLPMLWLTLTLAGALLTGRPYSHYFLQVFPPLVLLVMLIATNLSWQWRPRWSQLPALAVAVTLAMLWMGVVRPEFNGNVLALQLNQQQRGYYTNFAEYAVGSKSRNEYEDFFDKRVLLTRRLDQTLLRLGGRGAGVYVWGEYPWVYPLADTKPVTPYMTSFYTLLIPELDGRLESTLAAANPRFIVVLNDVWPQYPDDTGVLQRRYATSTRGINRLLAARYNEVASVGRARVFERTHVRPLVGPHEEAPLVTAPQYNDDEGDMTPLEDVRLSVKD